MAFETVAISCHILLFAVLIPSHWCPDTTGSSPPSAAARFAAALCGGSGRWGRRCGPTKPRSLKTDVGVIAGDSWIVHLHIGMLHHNISYYVECDDDCLDQSIKVAFPHGMETHHILETTGTVRWSKRPQRPAHELTAWRASYSFGSVILSETTPWPWVVMGWAFELDHGPNSAADHCTNSSPNKTFCSALRLPCLGGAVVPRQNMAPFRPSKSTPQQRLPSS